MKSLFSLIIPFIIILIPIVTFIIYRIRIKVGIRPKIIFSAIITFILGCILSWFAMFISANGLASGMEGTEHKCVIGATFFLFLGYGINLIGIPVLGMFFYIFWEKKLSHNKML